MTTPGDILRAAREQKGWSIDEATRATKLSRGCLQNLENDRYDEFKADIFARGYLRNYARELGCDEQKLMASFERLIGTRKLEQESEVSEVLPPRSRFQELKTTHLIAAFLALIGLIAFVGLVAGSRAVAEDPAQFEESSIDSKTEDDVKKTRWLLEQPPDSRDRIRR